MANFHENSLVIAASEEDMTKVLTHIAENLAANEQYTGFSMGLVEDIDDLRALYRKLYSYMDEHYVCCFSSDPQNRYLSDTASVSLSRYATSWVLTLSYCTAWAPNTSDLDALFGGLPKGTYGVAYLDADEYDGYDSTGVLAGIHHGQDDLHNTNPTALIGYSDRSQLKQLRSKVAHVMRSQVSDLAELAKTVAVSSWSYYDEDYEGEEPDEDDEDYDDDDIDEREYSIYRDPDAENITSYTGGYYYGKTPPIDWLKPSAQDFARIDGEVSSMMAEAPMGIYCSSEDEACVAERERMLPGDRVVVSIEKWVGTNIAAKVTSAAGAPLGTSHGLYGGMNDVQQGLLFCMLPFMRASVASVTSPTIEYTSTGSCEIRLELVEFDAAAITKYIHEFLGRGTAERNHSTAAWEVM